MKTLFVIAITSVLATTACAADSDEMDKQQLEAEARFRSLDANQDGVISRQEIVIDQKLLDRFSAADLNKDGVINHQEYSIHTGQVTGAGRTGSGQSEADMTEAENTEQTE